MKTLRLFPVPSSRSHNWCLTELGFIALSVWALNGGALAADAIGGTDSVTIKKNEPVSGDTERTVIGNCGGKSVSFRFLGNRKQSPMLIVNVGGVEHAFDGTHDFVADLTYASRSPYESTNVYGAWIRCENTMAHHVTLAVEGVSMKLGHLESKPWRAQLEMTITGEFVRYSGLTPIE
jgi:hypothetical protein